MGQAQEFSLGAEIDRLHETGITPARRPRETAADEDRAGRRLRVLVREGPERIVGAERDSGEPGLPVALDEAEESADEQVRGPIGRCGFQLLLGVADLLEGLPEGR